MTELAVQEKVELRIPTPILDTINHSLAGVLKKNLSEITEEVNGAIELGVKTDETAADAENAVQQGRKAIKVVNEVRLQYTRPIDAGKKRLMDEVANLLSPLTDATTKLDGMVMQRAREIKMAEEKAKREAEAAQRAAEEAARKEQERREKISLSRGGTGEVAPVVPEVPIQPVEQIGMRSTTRTRSIPNNDVIQQAIDEGVRKIPGVHIYCVWKFTVEDSKLVPDGDTEIDGKTYRFRKITRG